MEPATARQASFILGPLSMVGIVLAVLALQDIAHGEPDVRLEWIVVRIAFLLILAFHAVALFALRQPTE